MGVVGQAAQMFAQPGATVDPEYDKLDIFMIEATEKGRGGAVNDVDSQIEIGTLPDHPSDNEKGHTYVRPPHGVTDEPYDSENRSEDEFSDPASVEASAVSEPEHEKDWPTRWQCVHCSEWFDTSTPSHCGICATHVCPCCKRPRAGRGCRCCRATRDERGASDRDASPGALYGGGEGGFGQQDSELQDTAEECEEMRNIAKLDFHLSESDHAAMCEIMEGLSLIHI